MSAIGTHSTATTNVPWDAGANERRLKTPITQSVAARTFAWREAGAWPDTKAGYKFIHHMVSEGGDPGAANLRACSATIAILNGGRGGSNIPATDRQGVYNHVARHLRDAGRTPPPLRTELPGEQGDWLDDFAEEVTVEFEAKLDAIIHEENPFPLIFDDTPWAITPAALAQITAMSRMDTETLRIVARRVATQRIGTMQRKSGSVAVVPLSGVLMPRMSLLSLLFGGGFGLMGFRQAFREAINDPEVSAVVLDVDSPGGMVSLIPETAAEVRAARGSKPIVAVANTQAASAAYWIASQADEVIATPSGDVGSIGVYMIHVDQSKANEARGLNPTYIKAGKYKTEGNANEPLSDAGREQWQQEVNDIYDAFVGDVADGRDVSTTEVRSGYGEGRSLLAKRAVSAGLVDRIATLSAVIGEFGAKAQEPDEPEQEPADDEDGEEALEARRRRAEILFG